MDSRNLMGFRSLGEFLDIADLGKNKKGWRSLLDEWGFGDSNLDSFGGTYLLVLSYAVPRLNGESDILYIGYTENLGGNDRSRLWNYAYGTTDQEKYIWDIVGRLKGRGDSICLYLCVKPPGDLNYKEYEGRLLKDFREEHWELPPLNSQSRKVK